MGWLQVLLALAAFNKKTPRTPPATIALARTAANPRFPQLLEAARRRRELLRELAKRRTAQGRSQTAVAATMETSQSFIARLESTAVDAKVSTIDRYAGSLGYVVQYHLIPAEQGRATPAVVVH